MINGEHLIRWGYRPGPWFHKAIIEAERARREGKSEDEIRAIVSELAPKAAEEMEAEMERSEEKSND